MAAIHLTTNLPDKPGTENPVNRFEAQLNQMMWQATWITILVAVISIAITCFLSYLVIKNAIRDGLKEFYDSMPRKLTDPNSNEINPIPEWAREDPIRKEI